MSPEFRRRAEGRCLALVLPFPLLLLLVPGILAAQVEVVTTTADLAAIARAVGGDRVEVENLVRPMQDPHYLDATPGMIVRTTDADVFVQNGMQLEIGWIPEVLRQTRNRDVRPGGPGHVDASQGVEAIQVPDEVDRAEGDIHPEGNPHYTLDPVESIHAARNVAQALQRVDPDHAQHYGEGLEAYREEMEALVSRYQERFQEHRGAGVIIYHPTFDYFLKRLGLEIVDAVEPYPGVSPSARHVADLIDSWGESDRVRVVVLEPWHDDRLAQQVADGVGVPLVELCPAVGCEDTTTVAELFRYNADRLLEALEEGAPGVGVLEAGALEVGALEEGAREAGALEEGQSRSSLR